MDQADNHHTKQSQRAGREWLTLSRRERQKLIKENRQHVARWEEDRHRPGSNVPPVTDADAKAETDRARAAVAKILAGTQITHPGQRLLWQEIIASARSYQAGGNTAETALWALTAILRFLQPPGSTLRDLDALAHVRIMLNAAQDAVDGKLATFQALLPKREAPKGGAARLSTVAGRRTYIAAGLEGLTRQGGFTRTVAKTMVRDEFGKNGISVTEGSVLQSYKRRKHDADAFAVFEELTANVPGPRPKREAWLKQLAEFAGCVFGSGT